jgi:hypothetical protein
MVMQRSASLPRPGRQQRGVYIDKDRKRRVARQRKILLGAKFFKIFCRTKDWRLISVSEVLPVALE